MARLASILAGYATVARAAEVLHLAPRSVRDLIYSGRLPSIRIGRRHYVRGSDLESERRRRLGLRAPIHATRQPGARVAVTRRPVQHHVDAELRRIRAAERAAVAGRWAERHAVTEPQVPFTAAVAFSPGTCPICSRQIGAGARVVDSLREEARLCLTCGRRALLDWADRRRLESAAARRLAHTVGARTEADQATRVA